jgi:hypothetical protein
MKKISAAAAPGAVTAPVADVAALRASLAPGDAGHAVLQSLLVNAAPGDIIRLAPAAVQHNSATAEASAVAILFEELFAEAATLH